MNSYASDPRKVDGPGIPPALDVLTRLTARHYVSQCLYTFVKIGVPDAMGGEVLTPPEIAMRLKMYVNVDYLARILRLLSSEGVVTEHKSNAGGAVYSLTDAGKLLQTDVPEQSTLSAFVKVHTNPATWGAWGKLHDAILVPSTSEDETTSIGNAIPFKEDKQSFFYSGAYGNNPMYSEIEPVLYYVETGMEFFPYLQKHQQDAETFSKAMDVYTAHELPAVLKYDWTKLNGKTVVDLGGSFGTTMENVANTFPDIGKCISLDTPDVTRMAPKPSNKKVELVAGDFFESSTIPRCDAIFMKHILHDWNDTMAKKIIKACHEPLNEGGRLIIGEYVVAEIGDSSPDTIPAKELDILMMVLLGGRERSAKEWEALVCADSLFKLENAIPSTGELSAFSFVKI